MKINGPELVNGNAIIFTSIYAISFNCNDSTDQKTNDVNFSNNKRY